MTTARIIDALLHNYRDFDIGRLRCNFEQDKTDHRVLRPVERYSYALMRAALNVFVHQHFAEMLNCLAFDCENFTDEVKTFMPIIWPEYVAEANRTLPTTCLHQLSELEFEDARPSSAMRVGAWHRIVFQECNVDFLLMISNARLRSGAFEGSCFLENDRNLPYAIPQFQDSTSFDLGSAHLGLISEEILKALGISTESAIATIKLEMQ